MMKHFCRTAVISLVLALVWCPFGAAFAGSENSNSANAARGPLIAGAANLLKDGTYRPVTFNDKLSLAASVISDSSKLKNVAFAAVYPISAFGADENSARRLFAGQLSGEITFVDRQQLTDSGLVAVDGKSLAKSYDAMYLPSTCMDKHSAPDTVTVKAECTQAFINWMASDGAKDKVILASSPKLLDVTSAMTMISWDAAGSTVDKSPPSVPKK